MNPEEEKSLKDILKKGKFTIKDMRDQYNYIIKLGLLDKVMEMIPGKNNIMPEGGEKEASKKIKKYICIMDSMNNDELNCKVKIDENRAKRISRGSGCTFSEVKFMLDEYKKFSKIMEKVNWFKGKFGENQRNSNQLF